MAFEGSGSNALTIASADAFFKRYYINNRMIDALLYAPDPFLNRLKRQPITQTVQGNKIVLPVLIGRNPSASKKFDEAQSQSKARTGARGVWMLDIDSEYGVIRVSDKAILASQTNRGAFFRLLRQEADLAIKGVQQRLCTALFADTTNSAGIVSSKSGSTATLTQAHMGANFDINDKVEFRTSAGVERAGNPYYVTKVDRAGLVLTMDKAVNAAVAANDVIYRVGDYGETAKTSLSQWIPKSLTTPALGTLNNVDRTLDPLRLAGHRKQMAQADRFDDTIRKLCAQIFMLTGDSPTIAVVNPLVENLIATEQRAQIRFDSASGKGAADMISAGVGGLAIKTSSGPVELVQSAFCPVDTIYVLNEKDVGLFYMASGGDDAVFFKKTEAGGYFKTAHDSAGIEARIESFGNYIVQNPGLHGRITLPSAGTNKVPTFN